MQWLPAHTSYMLHIMLQDSVKNIFLVHSVNLDLPRNKWWNRVFMHKNKPKGTLLPLNNALRLLYMHGKQKWIMVYWFTTKTMINIVYTGVFNVCVRLGKSWSSLWTKGIVLWSTFSTIRFLTSSVFLWDKQPKLPPNRKGWLTEWCWTCQVLVHGYESITQGRSGHKATLDSVGDTRGAQGKSGTIHYVHVKSYRLV